jgi:LacI family transcriptional regulator
VDGVILAITKNTVDMSFLEKFKLVGIPVMCIVREPQNHCYDYVSLNNNQGAFQATKHLIKKGHLWIAHIMGPETLQISQVRFDGYQKALEKYKIPLDMQLVKKVDFSQKETEKAMSELMKLENPPTAIFNFKNEITLDAIRFLKRKYPERLTSIDFTDFGNLPFFDYLDHKPIASIEEDFHEVGRRAAELLFQKIKGDNSSLNDQAQNVEIPCKLVIHND